MKLSKADQAWRAGYLAGLKAAKEEQASPKNLIIIPQSYPAFTEKSRQLINWYINKLSDPFYFNSVAETIKKHLELFLQQDRKILLKKIEAKMRKGSVEHPNPFLTTDQINAEYENEQVDLFGWLGIFLWNQKRRKE